MQQQKGVNMQKIPSMLEHTETKCLYSRNCPNCELWQDSSACQMPHILQTAPETPRPGEVLDFTVCSSQIKLPDQERSWMSLSVAPRPGEVLDFTVCSSQIKLPDQERSWMSLSAAPRPGEVLDVTVSSSQTRRGPGFHCLQLPNQAPRTGEVLDFTVCSSQIRLPEQERSWISLSAAPKSGSQDRRGPGFHCLQLPN